MKTHLVIPDCHAHAEHNNDRADWLGRLITDVRPDVIINMGDSTDLPSLSGYDKGKRGFQGRTYRKDIDAHLDFQERMWAPLKKQKKRKPDSVFLIGNHEQRIDRALDASPELVGSISYLDLQLDDYYDEIVYYTGDTPGVTIRDGIAYSHYFISGVMGRPIGGEHPAYSLLCKEFQSCTQGHVHVLDYCERTTAVGKKIHGLVCGVFQDYNSDWAGEVNKLWWRGVIVKRNVHEGQYDIECISIDQLRRRYG